MYPENQLQTPEILPGLIGSFWSHTFQGRGEVLAYATAVAEAYLQTAQASKEMFDTQSRLTCPVLRRQNWTPIRLRQSDAGAVPYLLGAAGELGNAPGLLGATTGNPLTFSVGRWAALPFLTTQQVNPTVLWTSGLDYTYDGSLLTFRTDPFDDDRIPRLPIYNEVGEQTDWQIVLWAYAAQEDVQTLYSHYGYVLGVQAPSSDAYKGLVNGLMDSLTGGSSSQTLRETVSAITGVPVTREPEETVEVVKVMTDHLVIATTAHAYRLPKNATPAVSVGDVLPAGSFLVDTVQLFELNRKAVPDVTCISLDRNLLPGGYNDSLLFFNRNVPLLIDDSEETVRVRFHLGGHPLDVDRFWRHLESKEDAYGYTLAGLLDTREEPTTPPSALTLPATVNPLEFLVQNVLTNNALLLKVRCGSLGAGVGLQWTKSLRRIVPPHNYLLVIIEMPELSDSATIADNDELDIGPAQEPLADSAPALAADDIVGIRTVGIECQ